MGVEVATCRDEEEDAVLAELQPNEGVLGIGRLFFRT